MGDELFDTLQEVKVSGPCTAPRVFDALRQHGKLVGSGVTSINNRLEILRAMGLLSRSRFGKSWLYSATGKRAR